jgi:ATP-dependent exoDNAse (exonuclease V) beta subunit
MSKHRSQTKKCKKTRKSKSSKVNKSCKKQNGGFLGFGKSDGDKLYEDLKLKLADRSTLKQKIQDEKLRDKLNETLKFFKNINYYDHIHTILSDVIKYNIEKKKQNEQDFNYIIDNLKSMILSEDELKKNFREYFENKLVRQSRQTYSSVYR